ncbi:MAG TPA: CoA pyrophosphatase [Gemmatimonadales bacterium]|nr:CoA pyrophosphatase [Gemmatimonadales bacterium]
MSRLQALHEALSRQPPREAAAAGQREAAIAIVVVPNPDRLLLIVRAERGGDPWSGQVACPGGRREPGDADLLDTAIRETAEEVGLDLALVPDPIQLDDLAPTTPTLPVLLVRPFLFTLDRQPMLRPNREVAGYEWVSFERLVATGARCTTEIEVAGAVRHVAGYQLERGLLWGMTERIVTPVVELWRELGTQPD